MDKEGALHKVGAGSIYAIYYIDLRRIVKCKRFRILCIWKVILTGVNISLQSCLCTNKLFTDKLFRDFVERNFISTKHKDERVHILGKETYNFIIKKRNCQIMCLVNAICEYFGCVWCRSVTSNVFNTFMGLLLDCYSPYLSRFEDIPSRYVGTIIPAIPGNFS